MTDYTTLSALELASLLRRRELSVPALTAAFLDKEDTCNAFITRDREAAMRQATAVQQRLDSGIVRSSLAGVPIAVKDNLCTKGIRTTCASKMLADFVPPYDAFAVQRLKAADMVLLGKTNMDEFAMGSTGETSFFGAATHPQDKTRVPGGSSSGSAAAVAAHLAPIALGTDTGGSVRQPAAYCGLVGLKPTYGAVSRYGLIAYASSLDTVGVLGSNVSDVAAAYHIIKGRDSKDATSCDSADFSLSDITRDAHWRILEAEALPYLDKAVPAYYIIACAEASSNLARYDGIRYGCRAPASALEEGYVRTRTEAFGYEVKKRIMLGNFVLSSGYYEAYYLKACKVKQQMKDAFCDVFREYDFVLTPTVCHQPPLLGESLAHPLEMYRSDVYTVIANLTGLPAVTLQDGRQLIGKPFSEAALLNAAYQLERATR